MFFYRLDMCSGCKWGVGTDSDSGSDGPAPCDDPAEETIVRSPKGKGIDLCDIDFSVDDSILPGWDPDLAYGDGSGMSEAPIPDFDDFFAGLPSCFDPPSSVDEMGRSKIVAKGSRIINGRLGIAREDREIPGMIRKTRQVMRFWPQIKAREEGW
ncbi:hypothetical protein Bca52824_047963 [Brassica carinata]|uniref:Uncharacterized protein n=1 Tax=Brassica carinata TaxID=52824 RepID=A0A8X7URP2_BRACI|nr:hypothetical protein Bca52824_047963 [Brassica carinata]